MSKVFTHNSNTYLDINGEPCSNVFINNNIPVTSERQLPGEYFVKTQDTLLQDTVTFYNSKSDLTVTGYYIITYSNVNHENIISVEIIKS